MSKIQHSFDHVLKNNNARIDQDEPITDEVLDDIESPVVQLIVYINTLNTFIGPLLNQASKKGDETKMLTLGPFCFV